mmetsp:Transcript_17659/g.21755  ORF Transcript_17659/g.21755 Transcript_17659/m.21755 type:complete len:88 (-) Transcript_17659:1410-1673(-)
MCLYALLSSLLTKIMSLFKLKLQIDHATKAIVYQLGWRVVDADDPETIVGFWKASFQLRFRILTGDRIIHIGGFMKALREEYEYTYA